MTIKVGQFYKGKMSGRIREVVAIVQEVQGIDEQVETWIQTSQILPNHVDYRAWWTPEELQKVCILVEEE